MSRFTIVCVVLVLAGASGTSSLRLRSNYNDVQTFVTSFMTAYEGNLFNSTSVCFSNVATAKLDADIVAMMKALTFGKLEDFSIYIQTFVTDFQNALFACQVNDIRTSFRNNIKYHGWEYMAGNLFWRAIDIGKALGKAFDDIVKTNVADCGSQFGTIMKYLNPPMLSNKTTVRIEPDYMGKVIDGVLKGLESNTNSANQCYSDLMALTADITQTQTDFQQLASGDITVVFTVISDLRSILSALQSDSSACNLPALGTILVSLLTTDGIETVVDNFYANIDTITSASEAYKTCDSDPYQCGFSTGEIFRLVTGWSI